MLFVLIAYNLFRVDAIIASDRDVVDRLKADVTYLCSPELAGRNVPGPTGDSTALWIVRRFREIGTQPAMGDTSFLQTVPLVTGLLDTANTKLTIEIAATFRGIGGMNCYDNDWGDRFYTFPKRIATVDVRVRPLYCGYGIVSEELDRNDFLNTDGKAAIVLPGTGDLPPEKAGRFLRIPFKASAAEKAGSTMLVVLYERGGEEIWQSAEIIDKIRTAHQPLVDLPSSSALFPTVYTSNSYRPEDMRWVDLKIAFKDIQQNHGYNVIGKIESSVNEYVVIGAHYDHLGIVEGDEQSTYFPGADDNASGVAGLLEICRRWAERDRTGRGLIAVAFTAEEDGTLGSQWFVDNLPVAREDITAMVNLDMIGRRGFANMRDVNRGDAEPDPKYAGAYFSAASPKLRDVLRAASDYVDLNVELQPVNSFSHFGDAGPFHEAQVPTVHLFSGFHNDYHTPNDTIDKLDFEKMSLMVDLADALLVNLSQELNRIDFNPEIKVDKPYIPH